MARTPLMRWLQQRAAEARDAVGEPPLRGCSVADGRAESSRRDRIDSCRGAVASRRRFIARIAALGALPAVPVLGAARRPSAARDPKIVVVGAGLAGLTAAYRLRQAGVVASVIEAAPRAGGRCWSERRAFVDGQIAERGGELVDTSHDALIDLAIEFGLTFDDLSAAEQPGAKSLYYFGGAAYDDAAVSDDLRRLWPKLARDARDLGDITPTFQRYTSAQLRLDRMSCAQWIDSRVDGGRRSRFGMLLANAYTEELGGDPEDISAISVVGLLAATPRKRFSPYEESDQRYHLRGGNDQLVERLATDAGDRLATGTQLVALARLGDGRIRLTFRRDQAVRDEIADRVVLAIPFTMLRQVDLGKAGFTNRKLRCIRELGMGRNTKLQLQFDERVWLRMGANGETRGDGPYQVTWEVTRAQAGRTGILNFYSGGSTAARAGEGAAEDRAREALASLQRLLPGSAASWNGRVIRNAWDRYPWSEGSYSLLKPGQYTTLHGIEDTIEGRVHFAGEQSSMLYAGYMNGAIESGQRAAREVIAALRLRSAA